MPFVRQRKASVKFDDARFGYKSRPHLTVVGCPTDRELDRERERERATEHMCVCGCVRSYLYTLLRMVAMELIRLSG